MPPTQTQHAAAVPNRAGPSTTDAKPVIAALTRGLPDELGNTQKVPIDELAQVTVRVNPATTKQVGHNHTTRQ